MSNYDEEKASRNVREENNRQRSEEDRNDEVKAHDWSLLPKETYDLIKQNNSESDWQEQHILQQESPKENTVLHIAALYGNDRFVEWAVQIRPELLEARNRNGDTPLHVAARAGMISTLEKLLAALPHNIDPISEEDRKAILLETNNQRNTFFHEALLNGHKDVMKILDSSEGFKELLEQTEFVETKNSNEKSVLDLVFEEGYEDIVDDVLTRIIPRVEEKYLFLGRVHREPVSHSKRSYDSDYKLYAAQIVQSGYLDMKIAEEDTSMSISENRRRRKISENQRRRTILENQRARSPAVVAILKQNIGILQKIVDKKKEWIHAKDHKGRNSLHYAASTGYLDGVEYLLQNCNTCNMEGDEDGLFPVHLASASGHIKVMEKLLEKCPNPREIVDNKGRNIVHIAAIMGQYNVIKYVLKVKNGVKDMINDKDSDGNTPLHLAASHSYPRIVQALTWDQKVDLTLLNNKNQTALDAFKQFQQEDNPPFQQRLTWCQLKSAGVQRAKSAPYSIEIPSPSKPEAANTKFYKDRINTLMVVSTLITTVAFAAGFTLPGGTNNSTPGQGIAIMLNHVWFKPFIFCITISMYGGISVIIILIWAQLGDITLALLALKVATPLLGITLATLSVAFLAGVHLAISDLSWLATSIMILCVIFIFLLLLLYTLIWWFPSDSSNRVMRYISFRPFWILAWLFEKRLN